MQRCFCTELTMTKVTAFLQNLRWTSVVEQVRQTGAARQVRPDRCARQDLVRQTDESAQSCICGNQPPVNF